MQALLSSSPRFSPPFPYHYHQAGAHLHGAEGGGRVPRPEHTAPREDELHQGTYYLLPTTYYEHTASRQDELHQGA